MRSRKCWACSADTGECEQGEVRHLLAGIWCGSEEGLVEDHTNREAIAKLLLFASTASGNDKQEVSLETYIGRMKEGQDKIYYLVADNYATAKDSPLLEIFKKKGIEVLCLSDPSITSSHLT